MKYANWIPKANEYRVEHPEQRLGQAMFNSLEQHRPDIANMVRATHADPFYDNKRLGLFYTTVEALWNP